VRGFWTSNQLGTDAKIKLVFDNAHSRLFSKTVWVRVTQVNLFRLFCGVGMVHGFEQELLLLEAEETRWKADKERAKSGIGPNADETEKEKSARLARERVSEAMARASHFKTAFDNGDPLPTTGGGDGDGGEVDEDCRLFRGNQDEFAVMADTAPQSWYVADATVIETRIGPNYKSNKKKAPSESAIFELVDVRLYSNDKKVDHVAAILPFPNTQKKKKKKKKGAKAAAAGKAEKAGAAAGDEKAKEEDEKNPQSAGAEGAGAGAGGEQDSDDEFADAEEASDEEGERKQANAAAGEASDGEKEAAKARTGGEGEGVDDDDEDDEEEPYWFIWAIQMPDYAPAVFGGATDGVGFTVVMYYKVPPHLRAQLEGRKECESNWASLMKKFMSAPCEDVDKETKLIHER
jgi:hypothetical protein